MTEIPLVATLTQAEALLPRFQLGAVLNQDQAGRRITLHGSIDGEPALVMLERAPFPTETDYLASIPTSLARLKALGANDIYSWFVARSGENPAETARNGAAVNGGANHFVADLKVNLIYPCTETHVRKYSKQDVRFVTETPAIYWEYVRPYMQSKREEGRLNWVYNILDGTKEAEDVLYRASASTDAAFPIAHETVPELEGFLLLPDLNWDRNTIETLHLLAIVERRDIWSVRDLRKSHLGWLRRMRERLLDATTAKYPSIAQDQLKLYVHYQPTYYHFHIHIVHVALEAGATQATGKAIGLESIMETLEIMARDEDDETADVGMDKISMSYTLGEASELWTEVFSKLQ